LQKAAKQKKKVSAKCDFVEKDWHFASFFAIFAAL